MKHPALARVFSVVFAILGLLLLISGVRGFGKADAEYEDRTAYAEKYEDRIENYERLHAKLENSADYDETMAALKTFLNEHEKSAAKHKTDTAIYSATRGGLKMGETMIVSARAEMDEIGRQLKDAKSRQSFLEGLLTELIASNKSKMPWLDALANTAAGYAVDCWMADAKLTLTVEMLKALMEAEPSPYDIPPYEPPAPPEMPVLPMMPGLDAGSFDAMQSAYQNAMAQYQSAADAWQQAGESYVQDMQHYYDDVAQAQMERYNQRWDQTLNDASDIVYSAQYLYEHALWEKECVEVKKEVDLRAPCDEIRRLGAALASLVRQANSQMASLAAETGGIYPGMEELSELADTTADYLDAISRSDLSHLSNEEFLRVIERAQEILNMLGDAFQVIAANLNNPAGLIAELMEKLHITEMLVPYLEGMLKKADHQMQEALEELWYQMGQLEKDQLKLEAEKLGLDKEAVLLSRDTLNADELKELKNNCSSARQLLLSVPEVKKTADETGELAAAARSFLYSYEKETLKLYRGRFVVNVLSVIGGVMALVEILAAYELIKKRFLLIAPPLICLLCAVGAEVIVAHLGLRQLYVAIVTAIFALVQLMIVLPKKKRPLYNARH